MICESTAPMPSLLASVSRIKVEDEDGYAMIGDETSSSFNLIKADCCSLVHAKGMFFSVRRVRGFEIVAKSGTNRR